MQDDSHTCTIPVEHARSITTFVDPMAAIKNDLICRSTDQIIPVYVPITINRFMPWLMPSTWDQYCGIIEVQLRNPLGTTK
ncbi:hypothetical protein C2G38_2214030 [Gigaspora rosea]|uniref:Uncharacterized protein n=1 Tax=Gigaspora rosea TaxID=44941 RepID=A0A397UBM8_9GLOM|nr:hypothetical protein C2G38_2214030 [Gigaspora rosea]